MAKDLDAQLAAILDDYSDKVAKGIEQAEKSAASFTVRQLKSLAPRGRGKSGYADGFASKRTGGGRDTTYTIYNKAAPGLTHLLENGHAIANQFGSYGGRTRGTKHWAKAEAEGNDKFEQELRKKIGE